MIEELIGLIVESLVRATSSSGGKTLLDKSTSFIGNSRRAKKRLAKHIEEILREVSKVTTYRAAEQTIDDAYVEPRLIDGAVARIFFRPAMTETLKDALEKRETDIAAPVLGSLFKRELDDGVLSLYMNEEFLKNPDIDFAELLSAEAPTKTIEFSYISISDLLSTEGAVILGEAGSGKSALLARLCYLRLMSSPDRVPIFLTSRQLQAHRPCDFLGSLLPDLGLEALLPSALGKSIAFYFDGLDELPEASFHATCQDIELLRKRFPEAPLLAACRSAAYCGELSFLREVSLAPFTEEQSTDFVKRWFKPLKEGPNAEAFLKAVKKENRIKELTTQPLLLALMCNAFRRYLSFSRRHSALFSQCVDALLWEWDTRRQVSRDTAFEDLDLEKRIWLHARLAFEFHSLKMIYLEERHILSVLSTFLPSYGIDAQQANSVLGELCAHYGLVVKWTEETYGFGHHALQEYLAGKWLSQEQRWLGMLSPETILDPWWRNTVALAIGLLSDATDAIKRILSLSDVAETERMRFAARCLRYDPIVDDEVRGKITRKILDWYHNGNAEQREEAFLMLVGINDEYTARKIMASLQAPLPTEKDVEVIARRRLGLPASPSRRIVDKKDSSPL